MNGKLHDNGYDKCQAPMHAAFLTSISPMPGSVMGCTECKELMADG